MIGTDRWSYESRLKSVDPMAKLCVTLPSLVLCLCFDSLLAGVGTAVLFCALSAGLGGTPPRVFLRLMRAPFLFVLLGALTIFIARFDSFSEVLLGVRLGGAVYGVSAVSALRGARLVARAMGCVASVYFTVLSTPVTDLLPALRRLHVPRLLLSLAELIYRFVFVLYDAARRIRIAQHARLGYQGLRRSFSSLGALLAAVFLKAYRKSDRIYDALESRGYAGDLCMLAPRYESRRALYGWCAAASAMQLGLWLLERGTLPF
ncbi:cobalt ECF transporter T component CbiQ [Agathobaculum sp.]|uniref:cobalt ECF transporter T component CbiQ n=1 Tax=Agathobaculum sp. TaxID=2048138 RepID=UPI002A80BC90|nr:cobalt ECF transporter T component CbiQ [Agathobaculum sp.]MDY3619046.1 cobalt ECF transporter T component CbiQ [Agathobaculum sp.]